MVELAGTVDAYKGGSYGGYRAASPRRSVPTMPQPSPSIAGFPARNMVCITLVLVRSTAPTIVSDRGVHF